MLTFIVGEVKHILITKRNFDALSGTYFILLDLKFLKLLPSSWIVDLISSCSGRWEEGVDLYEHDINITNIRYNRK